jgi:hypothetical protein
MKNTDFKINPHIKHTNTYLHSLTHLTYLQEHWCINKVIQFTDFARIVHPEISEATYKQESKFVGLLLW